MAEYSQIENIFEKELKEFELPNSGLKDFVVNAMAGFRDYFTEPGDNGGENRLLDYTKKVYAAVSFLLRFAPYKAQFPASDRDTIRASVLIHEGFRYGDGSNRKPVKERYELAALYVANGYWDKYIPSFAREPVSEAIKSLSSDKVSSQGQAMGQVLKLAIYLTSWKKDEDNMPKQPESDSVSFNAATKIVKQMVEGKKWDGSIILAPEYNYVYLDGQVVPVAKELMKAFQVIGQAKQGQRSGFLKGDQQIYNWEAFVKLHPTWDYMIYGTPGGMYIMENGQKFMILDDQARLLGVQF